MKAVQTILITLTLLCLPLHAEDEQTGIRGSVNRGWEAGKVLIGSLLLIPGFGFTADGIYRFKQVSKQTESTPDSTEARDAGFRLGAGFGSLVVGVALIESGLRNLKEGRILKHKRG